MLLAASESLVGTQQQKLQLSIDGIQKAKARNDQLVKVMINDVLCKETQCFKKTLNAEFL